MPANTSSLSPFPRDVKASSVDLLTVHYTRFQTHRCTGPHAVGSVPTNWLRVVSRGTSSISTRLDCWIAKTARMHELSPEPRFTSKPSWREHTETPSRSEPRPVSCTPPAERETNKEKTERWPVPKKTLANELQIGACHIGKEFTRTCAHHILHQILAMRATTGLTHPLLNSLTGPTPNRRFDTLAEIGSNFKHLFRCTDRLTCAEP